MKSSLRLKPSVEKKVTKYLYTRFAEEVSKSTIKRFDGLTKLKLKDRGLEGLPLGKFVLESVDKMLVEDQDLAEFFKEKLISILDTLALLPKKKKGEKTKNTPPKTTEFDDFKIVTKKHFDKIVFYPKGMKAITFTHPVLIKKIIRSMALPSPQFEAHRKDHPNLGSEVDFIKDLEFLAATHYASVVRVVRNEVAQIFELAKVKNYQSDISLYTHELLEIVGSEPSNKTNKAKISYIQKKCSSSGN
jgi:hypothetical protein